MNEHMSFADTSFAPLAENDVEGVREPLSIQDAIESGVCLPLSGFVAECLRESNLFLSESGPYVHCNSTGLPRRDIY